MLKKLLNGIVIAGAASLSLVSCTVSEPDVPSGDSSALRLKALSSYGVKMMSFDYDDQNRITNISCGTDLTYELTYKGSSRVPEKVVANDYDISNSEVWTNIKSTPEGYIKSYTATETTMNSNYTQQPTTSRYEFRYDSEGHLLSKKDIEEGGTSEYIFDWNNGLLEGWHETGMDNPESAKYTYSEVANTNLQWDPNNQCLGVLAVTGLFGKAPAKFFKTEEVKEGGYRTEFNQYAYTLLDNGLIHMAKLGFDDEGTTIFNFEYEQVK